QTGHQTGRIKQSKSLSLFFTKSESLYSVPLISLNFVLGALSPDFKGVRCAEAALIRTLSRNKIENSFFMVLFFEIKIIGIAVSNKKKQEMLGTKTKKHAIFRGLDTSAQPLEVARGQFLCYIRKQLKNIQHLYYF